MTGEGVKDSVWSRATKRPEIREYKYIDYITNHHGISWIKFMRPDVFNCFNQQMKEELYHALSERFANSKNERALVLTGAGERAFSTGEDLSEINPDWTQYTLSMYTHESLEAYHRIILSILTIDKPIIAALNGMAAGAGLSIALACDERFAVNSYQKLGEVGRSEHYLLPAFSGMGLMPDSGITETLSRIVGQERARQWFEPSFKISMTDAKGENTIRECCASSEHLVDCVNQFLVFDALGISRSPVEYAASKTGRNRELALRLTEKYGVFDREKKDQAACMISAFTRGKIREFQKKNGIKPPKIKRRKHYV